MAAAEKHRRKSVGIDIGWAEDWKNYVIEKILRLINSQ